MLLLSLLMSAGLMTAQAASPPPKIPANNPCTGDIHKYCGDVTPGNGRIAHCMRQHASLLSSGCKDFGEKYEKEHPNVGR